MATEVAVPREMLEMIMESAKRLHPRETILLLRGKKSKNVINVTEVLIPPFATHARGFSGFPTHTLPIDFSIIGTAHSHPSGNPMPSVEDLNHAMGRIILIVAFPYLGNEDVAVYDKEGNKLILHVT